MRPKRDLGMRWKRLTVDARLSEMIRALNATPAKAGAQWERFL